MTQNRLAVLALFLVGAMAIIAAAAAPVYGQATDTPTLTPTLGFTETPWARPTPTPWGITPVAAIEQLAISDGQAEQAADTIINAYNFVNQNGIVDTILFVAMGAVVFLLLMRFLRSVKRES